MWGSVGVSDVEGRSGEWRSVGVTSVGVISPVPLRRHSLRFLLGPGNFSVNVDPSPGVLATSTVPPWAWAMCLTIDSPRPVPPMSRERELIDAVEALEDARQVVGGMPMPVSATCDAHRRRSRPQRDGDLPPSGVYLIALSIRLATGARVVGVARNGGRPPAA